MGVKFVRTAAARGVLVGLGLCLSQPGVAQQPSTDTATAPPTVAPIISSADRTSRGDDCSRAYHVALNDVGQRHVAVAREALGAARRAETGTTGRWLFGPSARHDDTRARTSAVLTPKPGLARTELALYRQADPWVKSQGRMAQLQASTPLGGVVSRMTRDLRAYTEQPPHPALCAGAPEMLEHLARLVAYVERQTSTWPATTGIGLALVRSRVAALKVPGEGAPLAYVTASTGPVVIGTAAGAALGDGQPSSERSLNELIADTARIALSAQDAEVVARQATPLAALQQFHMARRQHRDVPLPAVVRAALDETLGLLEATAYLARSGELVTRMRDGLSGGLAAIKAAHARHCVCATRGHRGAEP